MDIKFNIDTTAMEKDLLAIMTNKMRNVSEARIRDFFEVRRENVVNSVWQYSKGDGLKEIDDKIANKFLDPEFQEKIDRFFDHHWEKIFEECMTRALQHKANGIAFNKLHTLPIPKG